MKFAIVFGANSYEHEISIVSAVVMKKVLKSNLSFVFIDKDRDFYLIDPEDMRAVYFSGAKYKKARHLTLGKGGFYVSNLIGGAKKLDVDCYVNLVHGADGEDGKLAGLFEFFEVPFIGPRLEASVMSCSKELTKLLAGKCGVKTLPYEILRRDETPKTPLPYILKPSHLGSSIGVSIVKNASELDYARDVAFEFDESVIVEPFVAGVRELNLAGFKAGDEIVYSIIEEPAKKEFLDFEQKYLGFSGGKAAKAEISDELASALKAAFAKIYEGGKFDGALIRCDFFVIENEVYLNEINPNPGSLANYLFEDFTASLTLLAKSLKPAKKINVAYKFINSITKDKGGKL